MRLLESTLYRADLKKAIANNCFLKELKGKSFFITGGLGLICSSIIDILIELGDVRIYLGARNKSLFFERFGNIENVEFIYYNALEDLHIDFVPDYIIHGASISNPDLYVSMPVETLLTNFDGIHNLLEFAKRNNVNKTLYISSSEIYGKKNDVEPFKECQYGNVDIDDIRSSYIIAKRSSEMLCKAYFSEYNVSTIIVRPGHIYGPAAKNTDKRISSDFLYKAAKGKQLEMKSSGMQKRSYCYSVDCAAQILTALVNGKSGEAYNIGHDEITTIMELAELIAKYGNVDLLFKDPTKTELNLFNPMNNSSLNNDKVKMLGYKDTFSVETGIEHTIEILKEIYS